MTLGLRYFFIFSAPLLDQGGEIEVPQLVTGDLVEARRMARELPAEECWQLSLVQMRYNPHLDEGQERDIAFFDGGTLYAWGRNRSSNPLAGLPDYEIWDDEPWG